MVIRSDSYQIENIQYRPGKQNANADSLSRNPVSEITDQHPKLFVIETAINLWENTNILDEIKTKQQTDPKLKYIIDRLRNNNIEIFNDKRNPYVPINDVLHKVKNSNRHYNQREIGNKYPLVIPKSIQQKLLSWAHDRPSAGHDGQQKTLFRLTTRVFWDSILNYLTRWIELFPLRTTPSIDIAQILINELFTRYGMPTFILSDNGPQFVSLLFQYFCETVGIEQKFTVNYHPQTNLSERINRTLKPMLAIFAQEHPHSWDTEVEKLALSIRTSINETTGETPAFMMFGKDLKLPMDLIIGESTQIPPPTSIDSLQINEYRKNLIHNLRSTYNFVREHSEVHYRLVEQLGPSTFIVRRISDGGNLGATNIDRMKKYFQRIPDDQSSIISENIQKIEPEIIDNLIVNDEVLRISDQDLNTDVEDSSTEETPSTTEQPNLRRKSSRKRQLPSRYRDSF
ncbi:unnamed protein product [Rotaria sordida]|uniref:Integrase catalytic domain-containing protein n=1 Tax=Rotaria sordida TaxID=392033 RepID=A0A815IIF8_9BILA|nr:unnamed protein product [Rotaria sordida]